MKKTNELLRDVIEMTFFNNAGDNDMKKMCYDLVYAGIYSPKGLFKAATDCKAEYAKKQRNLTKWELREDVVYGNLISLQYYAGTM